MKCYQKSWINELDTSLSNEWVDFENPMRLDIDELPESRVYISASLKFNPNAIKSHAKSPQGSIFYKILVNGQSLTEFHVSDPLYHKKSRGVSLQASTNVSAGNARVEVKYKISKNGSWELLKNQGSRQLNVLSVPVSH